LAGLVNAPQRQDNPKHDPVPESVGCALHAVTSFLPDLCHWYLLHAEVQAVLLQGLAACLHLLLASVVHPVEKLLHEQAYARVQHACPVG